MTDAAYRALGVNVPEFYLYELEGLDPVKLARYIPDARSLSDIMAGGNARELKAILRKLQRDFPADALLANWDVVGLNSDNILVDAAGEVWRIDNGGGLRYRAQGALKAPGAFDKWVQELWTMRDGSRNQQAFRAFGDPRTYATDWFTLTKQMRGYGRKRDAFLSVFGSDLRGLMGERLDTVVDIDRKSVV